MLVGEEGYWYRTRLGVRAEPLGSPGITGSVCFAPPPSTGQRVSGTGLGWLVSSSSLTNLNVGQKSPQWVLGTPSSLAV